MSTRILTLDPVTRIEGHLRVDVEVDDRRVTQAWASAQMWRGLELILRGRTPQDAWSLAQRICGVCTTVHAIGSIRAAEHALGIEVPLNAQYVRNLMMAQHSVQDHLIHFYHLAALDWVDIRAATQADPRKASEIAQGLSNWPANSTTEFRAVQERLKPCVESGRGGLFGAGYWGHPAMGLSPELNLMIAAHYLTALDFQRKAAQAVAILGGKTPHVQNLVLGGVATALGLDEMAALNVERLAFLRRVITEARSFVVDVFLPDVMAIARAYPEWFKRGAGVTRFLAAPEFPEDAKAARFALSGGFLESGSLEQCRAITDHRDRFVIDSIEESVAHAWYEESKPAHPWQGRTEARHSEFQSAGKYTWCKAPRFQGHPVQVGPVAQLLVNYAAGNDRFKKVVDEVNRALGIGVADYASTMGRILARPIRARILADLSLEYLDRLTDNLGSGDQTCAYPVQIPSGEFRGVGFHEAPRGCLSHWMVIKDGLIQNYQAVVPTTWNASPRDEAGVPGPCETALVDTPVADAERPLEVLRTVHSFDPCIACAVHTFDPAGRDLTRLSLH